MKCMPEKPVFLKIGDKLINLQTVSHVILDHTQKNADVFVGDFRVLVRSMEAYAFFGREQTEAFFVMHPPST